MLFIKYWLYIRNIVMCIGGYSIFIGLTGVKMTWLFLTLYLKVLDEWG